MHVLFFVCGCLYGDLYIKENLENWISLFAELELDKQEHIQCRWTQVPGRQDGLSTEQQPEERDPGVTWWWDLSANRITPIPLRHPYLMAQHGWGSWALYLGVHYQIECSACFHPPVCGHHQKMNCLVFALPKCIVEQDAVTIAKHDGSFCWFVSLGIVLLLLLLQDGWRTFPQEWWRTNLVWSGCWRLSGQRRLIQGWFTWL